MDGLDRSSAKLAGVSRSQAYGALGAVLSLGAPLGLCLLRAAQAGSFSVSWLRAELAGDLATYLYVSFSTLVAFSALGFALGRQADRFVDLSATEPLTGLRNRRALYERLEHEIARAGRYDQPLSMLLIDVDGLKEINDRFGHRTGDAALQRVASAIRDGSRSADLGARWGGDEFALLAPNTGAEAAAGLAERIRLLVAEGTGLADRVTVSVGVATVDPRWAPPAPDELVVEADDALYEAKRTGRNRVAGAIRGARSARGED
jgi:diguanylate cyclase (GGDEF)-like protein